MKRFAIALMAGLGLSLTVATAPAKASLLGWNVEYSGFWGSDGGGSIFGSFFADQADTQDGFVGLDEMESWTWNWTGNSAVPGFSISSANGSLGLNLVDLAEAGFFIDGRANVPLAGRDQGIFASAAEDKVIDVEGLILYTESTNAQNITTRKESIGSASASSGRITLKPVPEPASVLGLLALAGLGVTTLKRNKFEA